MNRLILSAAVPALLLAACAGGPQPVDLDMSTLPAPPHVRAQDASPPHMPSDLTPAGVRSDGMCGGEASCALTCGGAGRVDMSRSTG